MKHKAPFVFGIPAKGDNFTDRVVETKRLITNFKYGVNTILISPRRWGKSSLVRKAAACMDDHDVKIVYIDVFGCHDEGEFLVKYASEVVKQTSSSVEQWIEAAKKFLGRLMPKFTFGADPSNDFSLTFDLSSRMEDRDEILQLPEKIAREKGVSIVICIDEFQQIAEFADPLTFQKRLRSVWQLMENVSFCLFGSKKHMMNQLFDLPSKPFYKFGDIINLGLIPTEDWVRYIVRQFAETGKSVSQQQAHEICQLVGRNSSYVQQLSWNVWSISGDTVADEDISEAFDLLIDQNNALFEKQVEELTASQLNYIKAMVNGVDTRFSRKEIIDRYQLGSSANVAVVQKALLSKEVIYIENKTSYFSDPLLCHWLRRRSL